MALTSNSFFIHARHLLTSLYKSEKELARLTKEKQNNQHQQSSLFTLMCMSFEL